MLGTWMKRKVKWALQKVSQLACHNQLLLQSEIRALKREIAISTPENLCLKGFKVYSQSDEDGIIDQIFRRVDSSVFMEIGLAMA